MISFDLFCCLLIGSIVRFLFRLIGFGLYLLFVSIVWVVDNCLIVCLHRRCIIVVLFISCVCLELYFGLIFVCLFGCMDIGGLLLFYVLFCLLITQLNTCLIDLGYYVDVFCCLRVVVIDCC